jgi:SAM-dependent methyltransferase
MENQPKILDLGCGKKKYPGSIGLDISPDTDADVIHDMNKTPYPFEDNTFDFVYMDNIIEHVNDIIEVMEEVYRITKNGAKVKIIVPYFRSLYAFIDPTHKHFFTTMSFNYFEPGHKFNQLYKYSNAQFKVLSVVFDENMGHSLIGKIIAGIANRKPGLYEYRLSHLYPLKTLTYNLQTVKK